MDTPLFVNMEETVSIVLFGIGFTMLMLHRNLIKKILGMNIMDTSILAIYMETGIQWQELGMMNLEQVIMQH
jgi:multisubunit Na+/H+ antiporter MnhC subunit